MEPSKSKSAPVEVPLDYTQTVTRSQKLWFRDGNLIIWAEKTIFKVYGGILTNRSPVFERMPLRLPPPAAAATFDGFPVVHLSDLECEVLCFLKAIFHSGYFEAYPAKTDISTVAGVLRLSNKYCVPYLRRRALQHLASGFFTTLAAFDAELDFDKDPNHLPSFRDRDLTEGEAILCINLAREVGALWALPFAFYTLADLCVSGQAELSKSLNDAVHNDQAVHLNSDDHRAFLNGFALQQPACTDIVRFLHFPAVCSGCTGGDVCALSRLHAIESVHHSRQQFPASPLHMWRSHCWADFNVCVACMDSMKAAHREARQGFWEQLPKMYGLPGWEELEKMKAEDLKEIKASD